MFTEEILVKLGFDKAQLTNGFKKASQEARDFAKGTIDGLKEVKGALHLLNLTMIGFALVDHLQEWIEKAKDIGHFWGVFATGGMRALNLETEINSTLEHRRELLKQITPQVLEGDTNVKKAERGEQLDIADQPGKVKLLKGEDTKQAEEMRKLLAEQSKLEFDIEKKHKAGLDTMAEDLELAKVRLNLQRVEIELIKTQHDLKKEDLKLAQEEDEVRQKIAERNAQLAKDGLEDMRKTIDAEHAAFEAQSRLDVAQGDRSLLSLDDLAALNPRQFRRGSDAQEDIYDARRVKELESMARDLSFDPEERKGFVSQADEIRKGIVNLRSEDKFPLKTLEDHAAATRKVLEDFETNGMPVRDE
jgi:hypothetical protein